MLKILFTSALLLLASDTLLAQPSPTPNAPSQQVIIPSPPQLAATGYLLMDADTGTVIVEHNADERLPPASLTKMMSSYIVSEEIEGGRIGEKDMVNISVKAWRMGGSKMFIREGTQVSVEDLLLGVIVQSGNDATVALAEYVSGSEDAFVDVMNQKAALMGMNSTHFENSTGWPAEGHLTTARDLGILARAIINDQADFAPFVIILPLILFGDIQISGQEIKAAVQFANSLNIRRGVIGVFRVGILHSLRNVCDSTARAKRIG